MREFGNVDLSTSRTKHQSNIFRLDKLQNNRSSGSINNTHLIFNTFKTISGEFTC